MIVTEKARILIVDDDAQAAESLGRALLALGLAAEVDFANTQESAIKAHNNKRHHVVVLDLHLNNEKGVESGFDVLKLISKRDPTLKTIVLTGHKDAQYGIRALALGASNFVPKPADPNHILALVNDGIYVADLKRRRSSEKAKESEDSFFLNHLVGESRAIKKLREDLSFISQIRLPVLILGETGTGKGLCASLIHRLGPNREGSFVRYQPNFATADLVNSELFGHTKGAFTGAVDNKQGLLIEADKGTLFLDEVEELPLETQVSLLGVLQDKAFRPIGSNQELASAFRLVTATNGDIQQCLNSGKLRADFFHRINHEMLLVPPLRDRKEDLPFLAKHKLLSLQDQEGLHVYDLSEDALRELESHNWPGNVREFLATIESAAYRASYEQSGEISKAHIKFTSESSRGNCAEQELSLREQVEAFKLRTVKEMLNKFGGNQIETAKALGVDRSTLHRILNSGNP